MRPICSLSLALALLIGAAGCDPPGYPAFDRTQLLTELTSTSILPAYADAATRASHLHTATTALCAGPTPTTLAAAQSAWIDAATSWRATSPFLVSSGPVVAGNLDANLTSAPVLPTIDANIAAADAISPTYDVAAQGSGAKGYFALEYVLFAYPSFTTRDDAQTLTALGDARRCAYAEALAADIETTTAMAQSNWTSFAPEFTSGTGSHYSSPQSATTELVNAITAAIDRTRDYAIGRPLGQTTHTGGVESPYAGQSVALMQATLGSAHDAWTMTPHCLDVFLRSRNATIADRVLSDFTSAQAAISTLASPPLSTSWEQYVAGTDHAVGIAAYTQVSTLETTIRSDAANVLGVSVLLPADGD